jgi:hypothetical protein
MKSVKATPAIIHGAILRDAIEFAEAQATKEGIGMVRRRGRRFDPANNQYRRGLLVAYPDEGLVIRINPAYMVSMSAEHKTRLKKITRQAIKRSIKKNQKLFVALILGDARRGKNYFERFQPGGGE